MSGRAGTIAIRQLRMVFPRAGAPLVALEDFSLEVAAGEFVALVGHSGCGKTTILRIIAGLLRPTGGEVRWDGHRVSGPQADMGIVFQTPVLLPWRTVLENVLLPVEILGLDARGGARRARELLELTGLAEFAARSPRELSGGMQQRVALCRALVHDPGLLLLDEPFGALDAMTRGAMNLELLRVWATQRITALLITHSIAEAVFLADRVVVMTPRPGRVADIVPVDLPRPRTPEMRVAPRLAELVQAVGKGIGLEYL